MFWTVARWLWCQRFLQGGIDALRQDAPRSGRTPTITGDVESRILEVTLHTKPAAATHWSMRALAEHLGLGATTIRRVWQRNGIKPHFARSFKLSRDSRFEDKLLDVVGLYLNPPEHGLVLSCDEKPPAPHGGTWSSVSSGTSPRTASSAAASPA